MVHFTHKTDLTYLYFVFRITEPCTNAEWTYEEDLVIDKDKWNKMFNEKTGKLNKHEYIPYFIKELNKYDNIPCVLISKSCYFSKKGITIRFKCKHITCGRKYNLVNTFVHPKKVVFQVKYIGEVCHIEMISRRVRSVQKPQAKKRSSNFKLPSFANTDNELISYGCLQNSQFSDIFANIKQEAVIDITMTEDATTYSN